MARIEDSQFWNDAWTLLSGGSCKTDTCLFMQRGYIVISMPEGLGAILENIFGPAIRRQAFTQP